MRIFKAALMVLLVFAMLISFSGCIIIPRHMNYDIDKEQVSSVVIYDLRNNDARHSGYLVNAIEAYTLKEYEIDRFLSDLADIRFTDQLIIVIAAVDPSFSFGEWVVKINYTDGSYSLISNGGYGVTYDANGQVIDSNHYDCDEEIWEQFIGGFVPKDIFENQEQSQ